MSGDTLTLEERVLALEVLLDAAIWGPYLDDANHGKAIAAQLYQVLEAAQQNPAFSASVRRWLYQRADALAGADSLPDALRPAIRPFLRPDDSPE